MRAAQFLGVTVMPESIQKEGMEGVLNNLVMKAGANAIATSPDPMEPADERTGSRPSTRAPARYACWTARERVHLRTGRQKPLAARKS